MENKTKTIEMELPEDSIIRMLGKAIIGEHKEDGIAMEQSFDAPNGIQMVDDTGLDDAQYNEMLSKFLNIARQQQNLSPPEKIKKKLKALKDNRQKLSYKKGFLQPGCSNG